MSIDPKYLEVNFEGAGIRNSQKRLKGLIASVAIDPLDQFQDELAGEFSLLEEIVQKRVAAVIGHWSQNKHDPIVPTSKDMMSDITNASKNDMVLSEFYKDQVWNAMHTLAPTFQLDVPDDYASRTDELELALMELEEQAWVEATVAAEDIPEGVMDDETELAALEAEIAAQEAQAAAIEADEEDARTYQYDGVDLTSYDIVDDNYFDDAQDDDPYADYADDNDRYADYVESPYADYADYANANDPYADYAEPNDGEAEQDKAQPASVVAASNSQQLSRAERRAQQQSEPKRIFSERRAAQSRRTFNLDDAVPETTETETMVDLQSLNIEGDFAALANLATETVEEAEVVVEEERSIVAAGAKQMQQAPPKQVNINVLNITAEHAWQLTYELMGYNSEYIQGTMLPRWSQYPGTFEKDRRYLYNLFVETIRNAAGLQMVAGNFTFSDRNVTIDQLWQSYYADLSRNSASQLTAARLDADANDPAWRKLWKRIREQTGNISPIWMLALGIALIFDGLTTYVSLEQTPMEGIIVPVFTVLITALFQIADQLVINYRRREFDADALIAKYKAQHERVVDALETLDTRSESFVQLSMEKSKVLANWKAAEDNRRMARRGNFWSARIADINVIVTAYGFAFIFLDAEEPLYALIQQIDYIFFQQAWEQVNLWIFLMIGLAITVSFVVNTAQRTEILGWNIARMKKEA